MQIFLLKIFLLKYNAFRVIFDPPPVEVHVKLMKDPQLFY